MTVGFLDLTRVSVPTTGTGATASIGPAVAGFLSFTTAGAVDGTTYRYSIQDPINGSSEIGTGVYSAAGPSITRNPTKSTNANARINLSGQAQLIICIAAEDTSFVLGTTTINLTQTYGTIGGPITWSNIQTFAGGINSSGGPGYFTFNSVAVPVSPGSGLAITWNFSSGNAEVVEWNTFISSLPTVSFNWRQILSGGSTSTSLMSLSPTGLSVGTISASNFSAPGLVLNGVLYGGGSGAFISSVAVNGSATNKFLTQSNGGIPAWNTIQASDLPGGISGFGTPSANSIGTATPTSGTSSLTTRVDATYQINQAITPVWTATHTFNAVTNLTNFGAISTSAGSALPFQSFTNATLFANNYIRFTSSNAGVGQRGYTALAVEASPAAGVTTGNHVAIYSAVASGSAGGTGMGMWAANFGVRMDNGYTGVAVGLEIDAVNNNGTAGGGGTGLSILAQGPEWTGINLSNSNNSYMIGLAISNAILASTMSVDGSAGTPISTFYQGLLGVGQSTQLKWGQSAQNFGEGLLQYTLAGTIGNSTVSFGIRGGASLVSNSVQLIINSNQSGAIIAPVPALSFGSYFLSPQAGSLVTHIDLFSGQYGFGISGGQLNIVSGGNIGFWLSAASGSTTAPMALNTTGLVLSGSLLTGNIVHVVGRTGTTALQINGISGANLFIDLNGGGTNFIDGSATSWRTAGGSFTYASLASNGLLTLVSSVDFTPQFAMQNQFNTANAGYIRLQKARGLVSSGSASVVLVNDVLGNFLWEGVSLNGVLQQSSQMLAKVTSVGSASVSSDLHVTSVTGATTSFIVDNGNISTLNGAITTSSGFVFNDRTNPSQQWQLYATGGSANSAARLFLGADKFAVTQGGSVGIGGVPSSADSLLMINANTAVTTGSLPAGTLVHVVGAAASNSRTLVDAFGGSPLVTFRRADGTIAAPTAVQNNDQILNIGALAYGSTGYSSTVRVAILALAISSGTQWTDTDQGAYLTFSTTPVGSTALAERMRIQASGGLSLNTTQDPGIGGIFCNQGPLQCLIGTGTLIPNSSNNIVPFLNVFWNTLGGTVTGPTSLGQIAYQENLTAGANFVNTISIFGNVYGGNGGRQLTQYQLVLQGWQATGGNQFACANVCQLIGNSNAGGLTGSEAGAAFAGNMQVVLGSGATYYAQATGMEIDIQCSANTHPAYVAGLTIVQTNGHLDNGSRQAAAMVFYNDTNTIGWPTLILVGGFAGSNISPFGSGSSPLANSSIMSMTPITAAVNGIDLRNGSFSGLPFTSPGFKIDKNGCGSFGTIGSGTWNYFANNVGAVNPTLSVGLALGWNYSGGVGEVSIVCNRNGGAGPFDFIFYDWNGATGTPIFYIGGSGGAVTTASTMQTNFAGNMFAQGGGAVGQIVAGIPSQSSAGNGDTIFAVGFSMTDSTIFPVPYSASTGVLLGNAELATLFIGSARLGSGDPTPQGCTQAMTIGVFKTGAAAGAPLYGQTGGVFLNIVGGWSGTSCTFTVSGTVTNGSNTVTMGNAPTNHRYFVGMAVQGASLAANTSTKGVSGNVLTLTNNWTGANGTATLTFVVGTPQTAPGTTPPGNATSVATGYNPLAGDPADTFAFNGQVTIYDNNIGAAQWMECIISQFLAGGTAAQYTTRLIDGVTTGGLAAITAAVNFHQIGRIVQFGGAAGVGGCCLVGVGNGRTYDMLATDTGWVLDSSLSPHNVSEPSRKKDINIIPSSIKMVRHIDPVTFKYTDENNGEQPFIGFLVRDFRDIGGVIQGLGDDLLQSIITIKRGDGVGLKQTHMFPVLWRSVQDIDIELNNLKENLNSRVAELEARVAELEAAAQATVQ